jgi:hypothetical protein
MLYQCLGLPSLPHNIPEEPCDFRPRVSPFPVISVEILAICVQVVSIFSLLILMSEGYFELTL